MSLMLHAGAEEINLAALMELETPQGTATHVPIAHKAVVEMTKFALGFHGHDIVDENYGVTPDGARFFGLLSLKSAYGDYTDTVGLRNSHDKKFPIGISFGSRVFVCDNLAFNGDQVIKRRHTINAKRDLPSLVSAVVEPLQEVRMRQHQALKLYHETELTDDQADLAIMRMYRDGAINVQRVATVLDQWENPTHDWGEKSAWRLFNAATFALNGKVAEDPTLTRKLHDVIDSTCQVLH